MMKKNNLRILKFTALILPLILILCFSQEYLFFYRNYDTERIEKFYEEEENSLDVVFIGASELSAGFAPGYAYEKYGFTSYMYAMDANQGSLYLSQLKEILKHQDPEILFVDLYGFLRADDSILFNDARLRIYTESIPFSTNKFQTIMQFPCENKLSFFFPLIMHHSNLSALDDNISGLYYQLTADLEPDPLKGVITTTAVYSGNGDPGEAFDPATYKLTDHSIAYLVEFLDYCKNNKLDNIVFTNYPRNIANESNHSLLFLLEQAESIVAQYDYPVWNLQDEMDAIGIDKTQDYYNEHHLNIYGQVKLTDYIGSKVIGEYGLTPRTQSESNRLEWEACASNTKEFTQMAKDAIQAGNNITIYERSNYWVFRNSFTANQ